MQPTPQDVQVVKVTGPDHPPLLLYPGDRLVFGRDPEADIVVSEDPWFSRRAGEIAVRNDGVLITNLSKKQALYVRTSAETIQLPAVSAAPGNGSYLLKSVDAVVGSARMLDEERA